MTDLKYLAEPILRELSLAALATSTPMPAAGLSGVPPLIVRVVAVAADVLYVVPDDTFVSEYTVTVSPPPAAPPADVMDVVVTTPSLSLK